MDDDIIRVPFAEPSGRKFSRFRLGVLGRDGTLPWQFDGAVAEDV